MLLHRGRRIASRSRLAWFKCETSSPQKRKGERAGLDKACMVHRHLVLVCPCVEERWQLYRGQRPRSIKWVFKLTAEPLPSQPSPWPASLSPGCAPLFVSATFCCSRASGCLGCLPVDCCPVGRCELCNLNVSAGSLSPCCEFVWVIWKWGLLNHLPILRLLPRNFETYLAVFCAPVLHKGNT